MLNSRQMGKSSLLVRTKHQLQQEGYHCAFLDLTKIGSEEITPQQWYKSILSELRRTFRLYKQINLKIWWQDQENISIITKLDHFLTDILFQAFPKGKIIIFIDEIDTILTLPFPIDDFLAFIRYCYNQRASNPDYARITFAIFGVATPSDLIKDRKRTPFNIGQSIQLNGFTLPEAQPLVRGLTLKGGNEERVLQEILNWSNGQPFLTQKICKLVVDSSQDSLRDQLTIPLGSEVFWVENLVKTKIIDKWQSQDEPEHLRTIRDRIYRHEDTTGRLLEIYQKILEKGSVPLNNSREQLELILSGLVSSEAGQLKVNNKIYKTIFNQDWIDEQFSFLRPYSQALKAWTDSDKQDTSRLLRGQALKEAQTWSRGKSLSQLDYEYLAQSEEWDHRELQRALESEKIRERAKLQQRFLITLTFGLFVSVLLGMTTLWQYSQAKEKEIEARISEIKALISSSQGQFASKQKLNALIDGIKAKKRLELVKNIDEKSKELVDLSLIKLIYVVSEINRLSGHKFPIYGLVFSNDNQLILSASNRSVIKIWKRNGQLLKTINDYEVEILRGIAISFDNQKFISGNGDSFIYIWSIDGTFLKKIKTHDKLLMDIEISPNGTIIASCFIDSTIKLWNFEGELSKEIKVNNEAINKITFSSDGQFIATAHKDNI